MSQRHSEYRRQDHDAYWTPQWVYYLLYEVEPWAGLAWDCAPREKIFDFLTINHPVPAICTNPPFSRADKFIEHALLLASKIAMLLPMNFDAAKGRVGLFTGAPFKKKYVLLDRIRWENLEQKAAGPSSNHAWYVWDYGHRGDPTIGYLSRAA